MCAGTHRDALAHDLLVRVDGPIAGAADRYDRAPLVAGRLKGALWIGELELVHTDDGTQLRSANYGNTFYPQATGLDAGVSFYLARGDVFWAGNGAGLFSSDDDGVSFAPNGTGLPSETPVTALFFAGSYVVADTVDGPYITQQP